MIFGIVKRTRDSKFRIGNLNTGRVTDRLARTKRDGSQQLNVLHQAASYTVTPSSEKRLIKQLINNYEKAGKIGRPVKNNKETVVVGLGLSLFQLLHLNEKNQILTINVWTKYTWIDQLLRWDPANYSNIREVRIPPKLIWTPDIVLYNYVDERMKEQRDVMLNVDYLGRVFWSPPAIFKSRCPIDIRNFPFDYQFCFLRFGSATQHSDQMDLQFLDNRTEVDTGEYTESNEWTIIAKPARRYLMPSKCGKTIPVLTFFLFLKRNPAYYTYILVFPCILLSLITTVIFWLPPHIPAKMLLSMNIFVSFFLLLKILAMSTPSASTIVPFLGYFYCLNMLLLSISTFLSTIIINLHTYSHKRGPVPPWMVKVVRLFSTPLSISRPEESDEPSEKLSALQAKLKKARQLGGIASPLGGPYGGYPMHPMNAMQAAEQQGSYPRFNQLVYNQGLPQDYWNKETMYQLDTYLREQAQNTQGMKWSQQSTPEMFLDQMRGRTPNKTQEQQSNDSDASDRKRQLWQQADKSRRATLQIHTSLSHLRDALKNLMEKISKKDALAKRARDWRLVVMTIDRLFFWFYLMVVIGAGCYLLIPRGQSHTVEEIIASHAELNREKNLQRASECILEKNEHYLV
ncbi:acetylcholine receptor subunit alpha-L1 [Clonorchis sinensis]|uniref:Acetylcholine receptor subunit alpha-L1 n=1 Tax=Clonorchis sinensis TaxID=79923 RepID=G7Y3V8_CLOSI|nr:acetylcholine receptor subunit alpha-L1 [Clonorchis sinensis]